MSCIWSQMNSLPGQSFKSINQNCVNLGSMDQVRFAGTIGRLDLLDLVKYTSRFRNPAQVARLEKLTGELSWLVVSRELEKGPGRLGQVNSSYLSEPMRSWNEDSVNELAFDGYINKI